MILGKLPNIVSNTYKRQKKSNAETWILCKSCNHKTRHEIIFSYLRETEVEDDDGHSLGTEYESHQIVQCQGCMDVSFRNVEAWSEETTWNRAEQCDELVEYEKLYPSRLEGRKEIDGFHLIPEAVRKMYRETHLAFTNGLSILAGIGIRAIVEAVCKERNAIGKNLEQKIDNMVDLGLLAKNEAELLHSTRLLGNEAAHEQKPLDNKSLSAAFDITEHLLRLAYIIPENASHLPKRKP